MMTSKSKELFRRALQKIPGGVNSPVRSFNSVHAEPIFIDHGKGSKLYDVDGNSYIDYVGSYGPLILGHANEIVIEAIEKAVRKGTTFGTPCEDEVVLAELITSMVPSLEQVRMVNSGTEATMSAIRVARGFTGRNKIIKFNGCYHGHADYLLVKAGSGATTLGVPNSGGVPDSLVQDTLLADYNDFDAVTNLIEENPGQIAAIIIEPIAGNMGMLTPKNNFLKKLREICDREGIVYIFDEVMTGFRVARGGAQEIYKIIPDMTTFGKIIGGGMPVGAYGGRRDIMKHVAPEGPVYQAGTLSGNPVAMAAGIATLKLINNEQFFSDISQKTTWLINEFKNIFSDHKVSVQTENIGGMFGFYISNSEVVNYDDVLKTNKDLFAQIFRGLLVRGVYLPPSAFEALFMSIEHSDEDLEKTADALRSTLTEHFKNIENDGRK